MAIRFNKMVRADAHVVRDRMAAESAMRSKALGAKMVFMSHKTGDSQAEEEARYISEAHRVQVYLAEWDDLVDNDSNQLPEYILSAIRSSDGFLVSVIAQIVVSMWIGYEIGGAHAMSKRWAKIMYREVPHLPSVVGALPTLRDRGELDRWIRGNVS